MTRILVYADWDGLDHARRLGVLHARQGGPSELFEFEYDREALADPQLGLTQLDPRLGLFEGPQFPRKVAIPSVYLPTPAPTDGGAC